MAIVNFNPDKPNPDNIQKVYEECTKGIEIKFDPHRNPSYIADFAFYSKKEIEREKSKMLEEVSLRSAFFLLAYIENLFRTDFVIRVESHKKGYTDVLTKAYKKIYNPAVRPYSYSLTDTIFKSWRQYVNGKPNSKEMQDILRNLPQFFDFRNWLAHGRYWVFKESNYLKKYNYLEIRELKDRIELYFGEYLKKKTIS